VRCECLAASLFLEELPGMGGKDGLGGSVMVSRRSLKRTCLISDNEAGARLELEEVFLGGGVNWCVFVRNLGGGYIT